MQKEVKMKNERAKWNEIELLVRDIVVVDNSHSVRILHDTREPQVGSLPNHFAALRILLLWIKKHHAKQASDSKTFTKIKTTKYVQYKQNRERIRMATVIYPLSRATPLYRPLSNHLFSYPCTLHLQLFLPPGIFPANAI